MINALICCSTAPDFGHQSHKAYGLDAFCAVGLSLGLLGVAVGTFLMAKALNRN